MTQTFANFDEYWEMQTMPFHRAGKAVQALDETRRAKLREHLREKLPARGRHHHVCGDRSGGQGAQAVRVPQSVICRACPRKRIQV